ncbi:putative paraquat-inducible protein A [Rubellimicrobium thermophilum DSM 16684]|uniref:Putative paraquat-inducible protein A n=1 Tax=Rubellimicrobium thermophilum DSM 16684 TaxID=1123069 RepID=S9R343_9RHOB|nr:paraquat-inducible protein A [Rubellimicrobium thermophilum]EPX86403.1 putative paraquat-inducible protein A [Rubellimicrobium thermophilum DSM 16684]
MALDRDGSLTRLEALTAREAGLVACRRCLCVWPLGTERCGRCGARLVSRDPRALSRVWAWWVAGVMAYVPANTYPMLRMRTLLHSEEQTIIGGAIELFRLGSPGIALIILLASVGIPLAKFLCIAFLALSVRHGSRIRARTRMRMYEIVDYIGRWSMIDVFVVAILASLVQLGMVATINPGPAALAFALSVIFTMLSAQAFDPRLIWDGIETAVVREAAEAERA